VEAIAQGKAAVSSINQYLRGETVAAGVKSYNCSKGKLETINPRSTRTCRRKAGFPCRP
jgi:hypothetical protein